MAVFKRTADDTTITNRFCGIFNIKTGCWIVLTLQLIILVLRLLGLGQGLEFTWRSGFVHWSEAVDFAATVVMLLAGSLVAVALLTNRPGLLKVHKVLLVAYTVWTFLAIILYFTAGPGAEAKNHLMLQTVVFGAVVLLFFGFCVWVERRTYNWMCYEGGTNLPTTETPVYPPLQPSTD